MISIKDKVISRIYGRGRGWAFSSKDFANKFNRIDIDRALSTLNKEGTIRRVLRGIYDYPEYSSMLQQTLSPDLNQVAQALARKFNWRIAPSGATALNLLGLSTQVPGRIIYLSDGPKRKYHVGNSVIEFNKGSLKEVGFSLKESALIVQVLKSLGRQNIDDGTISKIRDRIDKKKYKKILKETKWVTGWIYEHIKKICEEE